MHYHELTINKKKSSKRVGRGISAGQGKTAGRGTKGQSSRTGGKRRPGFEGGQTPLMMRLPKLRGFTSHRPKTENIYTGQLALVKGVITNFSLYEAGLINSPYSTVKLIRRGEISTALQVHIQGTSSSAKEAVEKAGGTITLVPRLKQPAKKT